jgi:SAM-dependent methyltransferase
MWDERYATDEFVYGRQPNDFLVSQVSALPLGKVLCLAEGEGRNAVWLARQGYQVTAVDASAVGLEKARRLAAEHEVEVEIIQADLGDFDIASESWDAVVSIFCHLPAVLRRQVHARVVNGLRSGGVLLLEAYTPLQLEFGTGGPPVAEMMMDKDVLSDELDGLVFRYAEERVRDVNEGRFHHGEGAVVQLVARKP